MVIFNYYCQFYGTNCSLIVYSIFFFRESAPEFSKPSNCEWRTETTQLEYLKFPFTIKYYRYTNKNENLVSDDDALNETTSSETRNLLISFILYNRKYKYKTGRRKQSSICLTPNAFLKCFHLYSLRNFKNNTKY